MRRFGGGITELGAGHIGSSDLHTTWQVEATKWRERERDLYMDVEPKIVGKSTPKWMVKIMENPIKMDDLGVPLFLETPIYDLIGATFI